MRTTRKVTPKVKDGRVQKKDRHSFTAKERLILTRRTPPKGYTHVVSKKDVREFIEVIPDWDQHAVDLEAINLVSEVDDYDGYYQLYRREGTGSINLSPWPKDLWITVTNHHGVTHQFIYDAIGVSYSRSPEGFDLRFDIEQAKAYTLVHVLMHELGHHVDRITSRNQDYVPRGEGFAEKFANDRFGVVWNRYKRLVGAG